MLKTERIINVRDVRIIAGIAGLSLGALIYFTDRSSASTWFVREFFNDTGQMCHYYFPDLFGFMNKNLASFLHTFSFTMITGAFIAESKNGCLISALLWCSINVLFEAGQYFDAVAVKLVPAWFEQYPFLKTVDDYFVAGSFDFWDLFAILAGALTGYLVLSFTDEKD
ncbi:MAG: hypothetical protein HQK61_04395 [Desulfamplus sp.]|nr:hypothetical protein [Desulfamplus sp.]